MRMFEELDEHCPAVEPRLAQAAYPRELERDLVLKDGSHLHLRPIRPEDEPRLIELHSRLSQDTAYQRFFTVLRRLPPDWAHFFANVDYHRRLALVAEREVSGKLELLGVGRYEPSKEEGTAEVAFVVEDSWQGRGLGTLLFREVLAAAVARGIRRFRAYVLADNHRMLDLITRLGQVETRTIEDGVVSIAFRPR